MYFLTMNNKTCKCDLTIGYNQDINTGYAKIRNSFIHKIANIQIKTQ